MSTQVNFGADTHTCVTPIPPQVRNKQSINKNLVPRATCISSDTETRPGMEKGQQALGTRLIKQYIVRI